MRLVSVAVGIALGSACVVDILPAPDASSAQSVGSGPIVPVDPDPVDPIDPIDAGPACTVAADPALALCAVDVAAVAGGLGFPDLQAAIDQGSPVVHVCPGTHLGGFHAPGYLSLRSASGDPADTVLSGGGFNRILSASSALEVVGLSFANGSTPDNGGAIEAGDALTVQCSVFVDNHAGYAGGAISSNASAAVSGSTFDGNTSGYEGGAIQARGDLGVTSSHFAGNHADYEGGAISWGDWTSKSLRVEDSTFEDNHADYEGGAVEIGTWAESDLVELRGSRFAGNSSGYGEGVVNFGSWGGFDGTIDACQFDGNDVAIGLGGWLEDGYDLDVTNTTFVGSPGSW